MDQSGRCNNAANAGSCSHGVVPPVAAGHSCSDVTVVCRPLPVAKLLSTTIASDAAVRAVDTRRLRSRHRARAHRVRSRRNPLEPRTLQQVTRSVVEPNLSCLVPSGSPNRGRKGVQVASPRLCHSGEPQSSESDRELAGRTTHDPWSTAKFRSLCPRLPLRIPCRLTSQRTRTNTRRLYRTRSTTSLLHPCTPNARKGAVSPQVRDHLSTNG